MSKNKTKVAVLGGGIASLVAAFELSDPRHHDRYEITLYQVGWRLGGKCASGREVAMGWRTKEHGPHVLFGFYDNAFSVLRQAYDELRTDGPRHFPTFDDAVTAVNDLVAMEYVGGKWQPWNCTLPTFPGKPGIDPPSDLEIYLRVTDWLAEKAEATRVSIFVVTHMVEHLRSSQEYAKRAASGDYGRDDYDNLLTAFDAFRQLVLEHRGAGMKSSDGVRHLWILMDLATAVIWGALKAWVMFAPEREDIEKLNELDFRQWLHKSGARPETVNSAVVTAVYDTVFAYPDGDITKTGDVEAGSMFLAMKSSVGYRGAPLWKMKSGTGDVTAAPLYEALVRRGVKFEFFRRVDAIVPSADGGSIESIIVGRQVRLYSEPYHPLVELNGLKVWPDRPLYGQIVKAEADELEQRAIDLESFWTPWDDTQPPIKLSRSAGDFDLAVMGLPIEAIRVIAPEDLPESWEAMFKVTSVATQAIHLWFTKTVPQSGWSASLDPVVTSFDSSPLDTWFDATPNLSLEDWSHPPAQAAIVCGPMAAPRPSDPASHDYPAKMNALVKDAGLEFLRQRAHYLWPCLYSGPKFDWTSLVGDAGHTSEERFDDQFWRAEVNPTDLYVQSRVGTGKHRLGPHSDDYENLYLCGDWTDYGFNLGCFEGAVISGLKAANAITKQPRPILRDPYERSGGELLLSGEMPAYIEYPGDQTAPAPVDFDRATMWTFLWPADFDALESLTSKLFERASGGRVKFQPLFPYVLMNFCDFPECYPSGDKSKGTSAERELSFGIPGYYRCHDGADQGAAVFFPFLFLDNTPALVTGREEFGYFKQAGWLEVLDEHGRGELSCDIFGAKCLKPSTKWDRTRLITLKRQFEIPETTEAAQFGRSGNPRETIIRALEAGNVPAKMIEELDLHGWEVLLPNTRQIFLKQFRDIADGRYACYQAITLTESKILKLYSQGVTPLLTVELEELESTPVAKILGLQALTESQMGFRVCMDMRLERGKVLWQAK